MLEFTSTSSAPRRVAVRRSGEETYRHYRLMAGQRGDGFSGIAYAGKVRVFTGSGSDLEGVMDNLKIQIDQDFALRALKREGALPSNEELQLALALAPRTITSPIQDLLAALCDGPEVALKQLQHKSDVDEETLLRNIVRLAKSFAKILTLPLPRGKAYSTAALDFIAERTGTGDEVDAVWLFRPAFVAAARAYLGR